MKPGQNLFLLYRTSLQSEDKFLHEKVKQFAAHS